MELNHKLVPKGCEWVTTCANSCIKWLESITDMYKYSNSQRSIHVRTHDRSGSGGRCSGANSSGSMSRVTSRSAGRSCRPPCTITTHPFTQNKLSKVLIYLRIFHFWHPFILLNNKKYYKSSNYKKRNNYSSNISWRKRPIFWS